MQAIANYINGELVGPARGAYLDNIEPATGRVYSTVPDSGAEDVEAAVRAAADAFGGWSATPAEQRCRALLKITDVIEANLEQFARAESIDTGKPMSVARALDIPRAVRNFRFFATAVLHERSELHVTDREAINYTLRRPRGIVGLITPWNLPLYLLSWKVAPAVAVGNTVVAKPSELTPMTAHLLATVCQQAGLPAGVINIVHGTGMRAGAAIVGHPRIGTISFTGSTRTGADIARAAGPMFKKIALEMGGKNPTVVFADVRSAGHAAVREDEDRGASAAAAGETGAFPSYAHVVESSVRAAFANQGQVCLCGSRVFVERSIYDDFVEAFVGRARNLRIGDPSEPETEQGSLVSKAQLDKTEYYVEMARAEGGRILCGGRRPAGLPARCREGYFYEPTVIVDLPPDCRVNREEIFGPVVSILPFDHEDQAVEWANCTEYGLSASVWTRDLTRAHRVAERLAAGTVWVNCWLLRDLRVPFGGMKQSGVGREGGDEALRFFTEPKNVCVKTSGL